MIRGFALLYGICLLVLTSTVAASQATGDQRQLFRTLNFGADPDRLVAMATLRNVPVTERAPFILSALIKILDEHVQEFRDRQSGVRTVSDQAGRDHTDVLDSALALVSGYDDPATLSSLLPFVNHGNALQMAIARYGEHGVHWVAGIADVGSGATVNDVSGALNVLTFMLEGHPKPEYMLSTSSRDRIADLCRQRIQEFQLVDGNQQVIMLAALIGEPDLLAMIRLMATDRAAAERAGGGPNMVMPIQMTAREALQAATKTKR